MTDDTQTALGREAQAEAAYQESRRLALGATHGEPGGPSCWEYHELIASVWCVTRYFYAGPTISATVWWGWSDTEFCDDREDARALATTRNTPPEQQPHSFDATGVTETGEGER